MASDASTILQKVVPAIGTKTINNWLDYRIGVKPKTNTL